MNTKMSLTTLVAAVTLAVGGIAVAQTTATPQSSTAGAGCTATGNAMRGGNLGGDASKTACASTGAKAAAAGTTTTEAAPTANTANTANTAGSTAVGNSGAMASSPPMRVARADRN